MMNSGQDAVATFTYQDRWDWMDRWIHGSYLDESMDCKLCGVVVRDQNTHAKWHMERGEG